jgi:two-component system, OmpR family, KDP operon response regulator KdpE
LKQEDKERRVVLAIDDHPSILRFIQIGLEMRDIDVITASSGKKGLDLNAAAKPDAIVLDIQMPDMNGFEVLMRLRELSKVPIVVISADQGSRDQAIRLGANEFLAKPFNTDYLVNIIETTLSGAGG